MKKFSLKGMSGIEILSANELKKIVGGSTVIGSGKGCSSTATGLQCSGNCQRSGGAAGKCSRHENSCQCR